MSGAAAAPEPSKRGSTRTKMLLSAVEVLRERGAAGVTIDEVLARSGAPRGSVYHHFPDGRTQLIAEALRFAGDAIATTIDGSATDGGITLVRRFVEFWQHTLTDSNFAAGCPVAAAAIGSADDDAALTAVAGSIFEDWRDALARAFESDGCDAAGAAALAVTTIAALEGAVVLCRSTRSIQPLHEVAEQLEFLIRAKEFVQRFGVPEKQ
jgi:TetR/AcrR family transcriptional regulator, lmrAB and yxaGH operons repressor